MNPVQMAQQIKHELQRVVWPVTGGKVVFGTQATSVAVVAGGPSSQEQIPPTWPWAMVAIDGGTMDPDEPGLIEQTFRVIVAAKVWGDPTGEYSVIGGARPDATGSQGRGAAELLERASAAVGNLNGVDGCKLLLSGSSITGPVPLQGNRSDPVVLGELVVTGWCTAVADYASPQNLRREGDTWHWDGSQCSSRFDFVQFRLVRKQGQEPSFDPSNGTTVYTGTAAQAQVPGSSGYAYTIFADYNPRGGSTVEMSSVPETGSWEVYG